MKTNLAIFAIFSLFGLMVAPAYAHVTSMSFEKSSYSTEENFKFIGTQNATDVIFVIIRDPVGGFQGMLSDPTPFQGEFEVISRPVSNFFKSEGIYNATAFSDNEKEEDGLTIKVEFDGDKVFVVPDFILALKPISDKTIEEEKTLAFTVGITEALSGAVYSLEKNPPSGASINSETGKFTFTPTESQGPASYVFDIVVTKGSQIDKESIQITVTEKKQPVPQPEPIVCPQGLEPVNGKCPDKPVVQQPKELEIASFVDETKDPQSYVDRYNNEPSYKEWFDNNYSQYSSIHEAVGLEGPKELAPFVDPNLDPQHYIDRYNNEITYKEWFDKTYPKITIYEAVGLEGPEIEEPVFGQCGEGTRLIEDVCTIFDEIEYGQCGEGTELVGKVCEIVGKTKIKEKPWWQFW